MKKILKVVLLLVGLCALFYPFRLACYLWIFRSREVVLQTQTEQLLTEEQAVELSREALRRVGEDTTQFRPRTYDGTNLYARNKLPPYNGYVLWKSSGTHPGFSVALQQTGRQVRCGVSRCE